MWCLKLEIYCKIEQYSFHTEGSFIKSVQKGSHSTCNTWMEIWGHRLHSVLIIPLTQCSFLFFRSNPVHGEVYSLQHYVIKFVSDLRQVGGFLRVLRFPPPIKLTYINEIVLKVAVSTINQTYIYFRKLN